MKTGRPRKDPARAQGHRQHLALAVIQPRSVEVPPVPDGLEQAIAEDWVDFFRSGPVQVLNWEHHKRSFSRLFKLYSQRLRLERLSTGKEIVAGSQGQDVLNPALRHLATIDDKILQLEQQFGLTPRSQVGLGIQIGGLRKTLEDLNREANDQAYGTAKTQKA